jgi:ribosomal protein L24E
VTFSTALVERTSEFLGSRLSRRSFINRSAFAGSAVVIGAGVDLALKPGTAYGAICSCGDAGCGCGSTCCSGFTDFCCSVNGGYNYCPTNSVMGGWWKADNSTFCGGPRYYMDCNATCQCTTGCSDGFPFCGTECDGTNCGCGPNGCDSYMTGCLQFRYGQCNQDVACMGRIVCRVVACIPPWEIDPSCTTAVAVDNGTAEQTVACWTTAPPSPPCLSPATNCQVVGIAASNAGYALLTSFGKLFVFGQMTNDGDESSALLNQPMVGLAIHPGDGYYFVAADGGVFAFGGAPFYGSMGGTPLNKPIVGMAPTPTGKGYWFVAADGGVFSFGDAPFYGSMGGTPLNKPIVGMAATSDGGGYWLVAADGGIFSFGDAPFYGSMGGTPLNQPIVGMAPTPTGKGYWFVAADGGIFSFGDAPFYGSLAGTPLNQPIVGMAPTPTGKGYWFVAADGGIFSFGDAPFYGSPV